ncbi:LOW QUALITY PROTEIN: uncharacterized protein LOC143296941 [Babylonia areolata]|uniref:LOW QUALITY PROTEIN: uncharacterized protein LOC143296941 n=1 Tax=Babylonia areolata TaxID=304850 RepID=UPI003FD0430E
MEGGQVLFSFAVYYCWPGAVRKSSANAMPVCIKSEPRNANVSQQPQSQPPPPPAPPPSTTSNGSSSAHSVQAATTPSVSQSEGPGASRSASVPQPSTTSAGFTTVMQNSNGTAAEKEKSPEASEDAIDYDSVRGVFGWATLDDINVPCIFRKGKRFVAVRIVEKKVLNKYPNSFPDELGRKEPLVSYFVTEAEAALLNEINTVHCSFEYGHQPFTTKDLIVDLVEFEDFYRLVKKTFPENVLAAITANENTKRSSVDERKALLAKMCGWMQINNTVTPYIFRSRDKYVPLSVIQYAAQLLTKEQVEGHLPTAEECDLLNDTCRSAGFDFTFGRNTKLLHIAEVVQRCQVKIFELPFENPLQHAQYIDSLSQGEAAGVQPAPLLAPSGIVGSMALPYQSRPVLSQGPPNLNPFTPYNPFMSMMNMISQAPSSASNHLLPRTTQMPPAKAMPAGPQLSLVRTQNAPIFYPPVSQSRSSQVNNSSVMSQTTGVVVPGGQNKTASSAGSALQLQGMGSNSPQGRMGAPVGGSPLPSQLQAHGGVNIPNTGQLPHVSSPSGLARLPPPSLSRCFTGQTVIESSTNQSPPAHRGTAPHPSFMPSPRLAIDNEMIIPGVGPVPRGGVPVVGYPPGVIPPGGLPPHMSGVPQPQSQPHPPHSQPHLGQQFRPPSQIQSHVGVAPAHSPLTNNNTGNHMGAPSHPNSAPPNSSAPVFPVQLSSSASKSSGTASNHMHAFDDHLKLVGDIKAEMVNGKSISCMRRNSPERVGSFCLVEAVAKLYFPRCNLSEFVKALQNVLGINLPVCTEPEAKAFIHFYNLPVARLNDNHMISLPDLKNYFPQISYMFRHEALDPSSMPGQFLSSYSSSMRRSSGTEGPTKLASPSAPITIVLNNNDSSEVISIDSGPPTPSTDSGAGARNTTKRRGVGEAGVMGTKYGRPAPDQRLPYRVDEVDGNVTTVTVSVTQPSTTASQVIVID